MRNDTLESSAISGPGRISTANSAEFASLMLFDRPASEAAVGGFSPAAGLGGKAAMSLTAGGETEGRVVGGEGATTGSGNAGSGKVAGAVFGNATACEGVGGGNGAAVGRVVVEGEGACGLDKTVSDDGGARDTGGSAAGSVGVTEDAAGVAFDTAVSGGGARAGTGGAFDKAALGGGARVGAGGAFDTALSGGGATAGTGGAFDKAASEGGVLVVVAAGLAGCVVAEEEDAGGVFVNALSGAGAGVGASIIRTPRD